MYFTFVFIAPVYLFLTNYICDRISENQTFLIIIIIEKTPKNDQIAITWRNSVYMKHEIRKHQAIDSYLVHDVNFKNKCVIRTFGRIDVRSAICNTGCC